MRKASKKAAPVWICRAAFLVVFAINVICALGFILAPESYAAAYQLDGVSGEAAVRGMGIVFLMWNATYPLFIFKPDKFTYLGVIIIVQQAIGCLGEACILVGLPAGFEMLASSIMRFIAFDGAGLVIELAAFALLCIARRKV